jgi:hypothetical protein
MGMSLNSVLPVPNSTASLIPRLTASAFTPEISIVSRISGCGA